MENVKKNWNRVSEVAAINSICKNANGIWTRFDTCFDQNRKILPSDVVLSGNRLYARNYGKILYRTVTGKFVILLMKSCAF